MVQTCKRIYIAGPMSGYADFNFPAFFAAQHKLEAEGWIVFNPANKETENEVQKHESFRSGDDKALVSSGWSFTDAYRWDTDKVIASNGIYMLKGWEHSPGARGEHAVAVAMQSKYPDFRIIYEN